MAMTIEAITNYIQISDRLASSGAARRTSVQVYCEGEVPADHESCHAEFRECHPGPEEGYIVSALKMTYVHIPVPFEAPNVDHL